MSDTPAISKPVARPSVARPLEITLYDPATNEPLRTYTRSFVPWGMLKKALRLQSMDVTKLSDEDFDNITHLVVAAFGDQFSVDDLNNGADMGEMMAVVMGIVTRASVFVGGASANPTPAAMG